MDFLKEYVDGLLTRIRSPIIASISISFALFNWKAIYFLLFAEVPALERLAYVEKHTSSLTAIVAPIFLGIVIALIIPYINWFSARAISIPIRRHRLLQVTEAEEVKRKKIELEIALGSGLVLIS